jgi:hypothetical protein
MKTTLSALSFALSLLLLTGCEKEPSKAPTPAVKRSIINLGKIPDTKGLAPSTNFFAVIELPTEADQKVALDAMLSEFKKAAGANPKGKAILRAIDDILGRLNDAGLCDVSRGELHSVTAGVTLPTNLKELQDIDGSDVDFAIIVRGKFDPKRTKAFCEAEGVKGTLIDGQPAWDLDSIVTKLNPKAKGSKPQPGKEEWFAYADDSTLVIGNRSSLRKSLNAFKGQSPSLRPARIKAAEAISDWSMYFCFANPGLIEDAFRQERSARRSAEKVLAAMPHDQVLLIAGLKADNASSTLILANQTTQENIQYSASASQSLLPKLIDAYLELIGEALNGGR